MLAEFFVSFVEIQCLYIGVLRLCYRVTIDTSMLYCVKLIINTYFVIWLSNDSDEIQYHWKVSQPSLAFPLAVKRIDKYIRLKTELGKKIKKLCRFKFLLILLFRSWWWWSGHLKSRQLTIYSWQFFFHYFFSPGSYF